MAKVSSISCSPMYCFLSLAIALISQVTAGEIPAIFVFGDSTADVGTNNYIPECQAKANVLYNGIDFRGSQPTGRFSNGYNTIDLTVKLMGYKRSPPPFLGLLHDNRSAGHFKSNILQGVNFASGGSGLLDSTGQQPFKKVIPLTDQIEQFVTVYGNISEVMGPTATSKMISESIFLISVGSNDIFEYFGSNLTRNEPIFIFFLMNMYGYHLKNLLDLGARKLGILSVPPLGCCPYQRVINKVSPGDCNEDLNAYAKAFYDGVGQVLKDMSLRYKGMKYSLGNTYEMTNVIIDNPLAFGFKDIKTACCGEGKLKGEKPCTQNATLCRNRNEYLFWDRFHPTQAAARLASLTLYGGSQRFVTPMNFSRLADSW